MPEGWAITAIITVVGFVANAAYLRGVFNTRIDEHDKDIFALQKNVVYRDTCEAHREGTEARVSRIERALNGKLREVS